MELITKEFDFSALTLNFDQYISENFICNRMKMYACFHRHPYLDIFHIVGPDTSSSDQFKYDTSGNGTNPSLTY